MRVRVRLIIYDKDSSNKAIKDIKEQEVYMGEIPLMTDTGSFVINGTQRVIVTGTCRGTHRVRVVVRVSQTCRQVPETRRPRKAMKMYGLARVRHSLILPMLLLV